MTKHNPFYARAHIPKFPTQSIHFMSIISTHKLKEKKKIQIYNYIFTFCFRVTNALYLSPVFQQQSKDTPRHAAWNEIIGQYCPHSKTKNYGAKYKGTDQLLLKFRPQR